MSRTIPPNISTACLLWWDLVNINPIFLACYVVIDVFVLSVEHFVKTTRKRCAVLGMASGENTSQPGLGDLQRLYSVITTLLSWMPSGTPYFTVGLSESPVAGSGGGPGTCRQEQTTRWAQVCELWSCCLENAARWTVPEALPSDPSPLRLPGAARGRHGIQALGRLFQAGRVWGGACVLGVLVAVSQLLLILRHRFKAQHLLRSGLWLPQLSSVVLTWFQALCGA